MTESSIVLEDVELERLVDVRALLDFLPPREKIDPNNWVLSGRSERRDGILLEVERLEDFRDRLTLSVEAGVDSRERNDEDADEKVLVLELFPKMELLFICSV
jgi:hypothetical protein